MKTRTSRTSLKEIREIRRHKIEYVNPAEYVRDTRNLLKQTKLYAMKYGAIGFERIVKMLGEWN